MPAQHLFHVHVFCFVLIFVIELLYISVTDTRVCMCVFECVGLETENMSTKENDRLRMFHLFSILRQGFTI